MTPFLDHPRGRARHRARRLARSCRLAWVASLAIDMASAAHAEAAAEPPTQLAPVTVQGNYLNAVGTSDAASQGTVTSKLIESRPTLRPAEVLEFVPGLIVTQHSGDGKANQYFLRGFNLDHGTDFATFVDGMPVNMPTHAHGQGYSDLNWLIPELVDRIAYKKGPSFAEEGDFASAGSARIGLFDRLPKGVLSLTAGEHRYGRALVAQSMALGGGDLLYAVEAAHNDGPWDNPERFHRLNGVLRFSVGAAGERTSLTAMAYAAGWHSTDQVPQRAVDAGLIGRFGAIDPTDGGQTSRYSLSLTTERTDAAGAWKANAYAIRSRLDLYSDFTYNLGSELDPPAPLNADQFGQSERRTVYGGALSRSFNARVAGADSITTVGIQARHDRLDPVGLYGALGGVRVATTQEARVRQTGIGLYAENATQWLPWFRSIAGVRFDQFRFAVDSSTPENTGTTNAHLASPKLALVFGPWRKTELFANVGFGFHSNDARGVNRGTDPATPLVRTKGGELGLRTELVPGLQTSLALWQLRLASELVFSGDAGDTEISGASKRYGLELNNHYVVNRWLLLDADIAMSRARFDEGQGDDPNRGTYIPGSINKVVSLGATVVDAGPWFGHVQLRYFGPRPLIEDNSQSSNPTTLAYLRIGYKLRPDVRLALDIYNLFDKKASDIDYQYRSRLPGEPAARPDDVPPVPGGANDIHFHPVEPRTFRLTLTANF